MFRKWILNLCMGTVFLSGGLACADNNQVTVVKHYGGGYSDALQPYLYKTLELILEATKEDFGPYKIEVSGSYLPSTRAKVETQKGDIVNVMFATGWKENTSAVASIEIPVFENLLGLRSLVINPKLRIAGQVKNLEDFKNFSAGQGLAWEDTKILESNGITVIESQSFPSLFPMLRKGRFDYIALSILEAQNSLKQYSHEFPDLAVHPKLYIFYPLLISLNITANQTELVKRMRVGVERVQAEALPNLFNQFYVDLSFTQANNNQLIMLHNPNISAEHNQAINKRFLSNYGEYFEVLE